MLFVSVRNPQGTWQLTRLGTLPGSNATLAGITIGERPHRHVNVLVEDRQGRWIVARPRQPSDDDRAGREPGAVSDRPACRSTRPAGRRSPMPFSGKQGRLSSGWSPSQRGSSRQTRRSLSRASRRATCPPAPRPSLSADASTLSRPIPPPRSTGARPATAAGKVSTSSQAGWAPPRDVSAPSPSPPLSGRPGRRCIPKPSPGTSSSSSTRAQTRRSTLDLTHGIFVSIARGREHAGGRRL